MSLAHKIALTLIKNVGSKHAKSLLLAFGDAESVFKAKKEQLLSINGIGEKIAASILSTNALIKARAHLTFINKHQIEVLFYTDDKYPNRLRDCVDAPILLYFKGNADLNHSKIVSIVGTRNATPYGISLCRALIQNLLAYDVLIVSGLAYGIDVTAHQESLNQQIPTVAVLGHGLDRLYPLAHKDIARKMVLNGGLLTEFLPGTLPDKENFPKRNRIIAGLSDVTVVVEAAMKGGALITAEIANSYHKDVFAFPGRTTDPFSEGCNFLIKTNRAALIHHPKDLAYYMGWEVSKRAPQTPQLQLPINLSQLEQQIVSALQVQPLNIDSLSSEIKVAPGKLAMLLLNLEMQGVIRVLPGKRYQLCS